VRDLLVHSGIDFFKHRKFTDELREIFSRPKKATFNAFISYSKNDKAHLDNFKKFMIALKRSDQLATWDDNDLIPGEEWDERIKTQLREADIIFLLVSQNFIATEYIWDIEIKEALRRHEAGEAVVIPILLSNCTWQDMPFSKLTFIPSKGKHITSREWDSVEDAWMNVYEGVKKVLKQFQTSIPF